MKRIAVVLILELLALAPVVHLSARMSGFSLIAHGIGSPTTSALNTTGANLCVATTFFVNNGGGNPTVSDSLGNTWTALNLNSSTFYIGTQLFYVANPTVGASHTFSATGGSAQDVAVTCWSGAAASPFDNQSGNTFTGTTIQPGSITPAGNNELFVTSVDQRAIGAGVPSIDSGFTVSDGNGGAFTEAMGYLVQTTAAAENPTWTTGGNFQSASMATFESTGGGATFPWGIPVTPIKCCKVGR